MAFPTERARLAVPAAPAIGATIDLFNSVTTYGAGQMRMLCVDRVQINFQSISHGSAANGLKAYASSDGGTNWDEVDFADSTGTATMPDTVAASTAGADNIYDFWLAAYSDFKLTYTNGGTKPTTWRTTCTVYYNDVHTGV